MRIVDNIAALRVHTQLTRTDKAIGRSSLRLSSGQRINSAGDDPSGFAIALHMQNQIKAMNMADRNTMDGRSLLETADAAMQDLHNMMHRMRQLAVMAANDTYSPENRQIIQMEIDGLLEEINDITRKVEFNNITLLNGGAQNLRVQVGGRRGMSIALTIPPMRTWDFGETGAPLVERPPGSGSGVFYPDPDDPETRLTSPNWQRGTPNSETNFRITVENAELARNAIDRLDIAMDSVSMKRAEIGAFVNRFEYTSSSLQAATEATSRSLSRVFDTDMAYEMMNLTKHNIMSQAGMAIMAQVNARPQQILQLIG
jgi:flagellin